MSDSAQPILYCVPVLFALQAAVTLARADSKGASQLLASVRLGSVAGAAEAAAAVVFGASNGSKSSSAGSKSQGFQRSTSRPGGRGSLHLAADSPGSPAQGAQLDSHSVSGGVVLLKIGSKGRPIPLSEPEVGKELLVPSSVPVHSKMAGGSPASSRHRSWFGASTAGQQQQQQPVLVAGMQVEEFEQIGGHLVEAGASVGAAGGSSNCSDIEQAMPHTPSASQVAPGVSAAAAAAIAAAETTAAPRQQSFMRSAGHSESDLQRPKQQEQQQPGDGAGAGAGSVLLQLQQLQAAADLQQRRQQKQQRMHSAYGTEGSGSSKQDSSFSTPKLGWFKGGSHASAPGGSEVSSAHDSRDMEKPLWSPHEAGSSIPGSAAVQKQLGSTQLPVAPAPLSTASSIKGGAGIRSPLSVSQNSSSKSLNMVQVRQFASCSSSSNSNSSGSPVKPSAEQQQQQQVQTKIAPQPPSIGRAVNARPAGIAVHLLKPVQPS